MLTDTPTTTSAAEVLVRSWGYVAVRGLAAVLFGVLAIAFPGIGLAALVFLFGGFAVANGLLTIGSVFGRRHEELHWGAALVGGGLSLVAGILAFVVPGITALALVMLIAAWAIAIGMTEIVNAIHLRAVISNEWMLGLAGVLSVVFGVALTMFPGEGALALVLYIGAYAIVMGALLLALAFRLRSWGREHDLLESRPA